MTNDSLVTRMNSKKLSRREVLAGSAAAATIIASPALAGAGPGALAARQLRLQEEGPTIIIATLGEAQSINPFLTNESEGDWRCKMLFDEFVRIDPGTYAPMPGLAASWTNEDLTFTFTLQPNAKFLDGSDVTADDVAFTIKGLLAKDTGATNQVKYLPIAGAQEYADGTAEDVSGIVVVDPKTLQITLAQPDAPFLFNLHWVFVAPRALLEGKSLTDDPFFENPVGAGPFMFEKWDVGADFVAVKNPNFWEEGKPSLGGFTHRTIADSNSIALALQSGDVDASRYAVPTVRDQIEQNPDMVISVPPFTSPDGWLFNCTHEWLSKREVRRAIAMALNTEQFAADSLLGLGKAGNGPIAPDSWAYDTELEPIPYDVEGAKALIAESGMPEGTEIRFLVNQGNVLREDWLTFTEQALQEIGIKVIPEAIEYTTLVDQVTVGGDYDACGVNFAGATPDPSKLYDDFHTGSAGNYAKYSNPELDTLLEQAKAELDMEKAKELYKQIQAVIMDEVPFFFAWYRPFLDVIHKRYAGMTPSAEYGPFHTLENWTVTA
jgi:peptide/nickel transport system substrate-binding protein